MCISPSSFFPFSTLIPLSPSFPVCTMLSHFGSTLPDCFSLITIRSHVSNLFLDSVRCGDSILPAHARNIVCENPPQDTLTSSVLTSITYLSCRADLRSDHHRKMTPSFLSHLSPSEHICALLVISPSNLPYKLTRASWSSVSISVYCQHQKTHSQSHCLPDSIARLR